ncbi:hypothetical protein GCM10023192_41370 [Amycolatopsis samaneae]
MNVRLSSDVPLLPGFRDVLKDAFGALNVLRDAISAANAVKDAFSTLRRVLVPAVMSRTRRSGRAHRVSPGPSKPDSARETYPEHAAREAGERRTHHDHRGVARPPE